MTDSVAKLRDEIITSCHAWSVEYMLKQMDKLISQAHEAGIAEEQKRIENFISESFYDWTSATVEDVLVTITDIG